MIQDYSCNTNDVLLMMFALNFNSKFIILFKMCRYKHTHNDYCNHLPMLGLITYLGVLAVSDPNIIGQLKQTRIPSNNNSNEQIINYYYYYYYYYYYCLCTCNNTNRTHPL